MPFANKEDAKRCKAEWYKKNRERILKEHNEWRLKNKDRVVVLKREYHIRARIRDKGKSRIIYNGPSVLYDRKIVVKVIPDGRVRERATKFFERNGIKIENIPMDLYLTKCASIMYKEVAKKAKGEGK